MLLQVAATKTDTFSLEQTHISKGNGRCTGCSERSALRCDVILQWIELDSVHESRLRSERRSGACTGLFTECGRVWTGRREAEEAAVVGERFSVVLRAAHILKHAPLVELAEQLLRLRPADDQEV